LDADGLMSFESADRAWEETTDPSRLRGAPPAEAPAIQPRRIPQPAAAPDAAELGARWLAQELCASARQNWPAFMVPVSIFDKLPSEDRLRGRSLLAVCMIHVLEGWLGNYLAGATLPEINWSIYGADAGAMKTDAEEWRRYWNGEGPE